MSCHPDFIDPSYSKQIYTWYLQGDTIEDISYKMGLFLENRFTVDDINEVIDYYNTLFI